MSNGNKNMNYYNNSSQRYFNNQIEKMREKYEVELL